MPSPSIPVSFLPALLAAWLALAPPLAATLTQLVSLPDNAHTPVDLRHLEDRGQLLLASFHSIGAVNAIHLVDAGTPGPLHLLSTSGDLGSTENARDALRYGLTPGSRAILLPGDANGDYFPEFYWRPLDLTQPPVKLADFAGDPELRIFQARFSAFALDDHRVFLAAAPNGFVPWRVYLLDRRSPPAGPPASLGLIGIPEQWWHAGETLFVLASSLADPDSEVTLWRFDTAPARAFPVVTLPRASLPNPFTAFLRAPAASLPGQSPPSRQGLSYLAGRQVWFAPAAGEAPPVPLLPFAFLEAHPHYLVPHPAHPARLFALGARTVDETTRLQAFSLTPADLDPPTPFFDFTSAGLKPDLYDVLPAPDGSFLLADVEETTPSAAGTPAYTIFQVFPGGAPARNFRTTLAPSLDLAFNLHGPFANRYILFEGQEVNASRIHFFGLDLAAAGSSPRRLFTIDTTEFFLRRPAFSGDGSHAWFVLEPLLQQEPAELWAAPWDPAQPPLQATLPPSLQGSSVPLRNLLPVAGFSGLILQTFAGGLTNGLFLSDPAQPATILDLAPGLGSTITSAHPFFLRDRASRTLFFTAAPNVAEPQALFRVGLPLPPAWRWTEAHNLGQNWHYLPWFGLFYLLPAPSPYIFHRELGWLWAEGDSAQALWFYHPTLSWLFSGRDTFPYLYHYASSSWLFYARASSAPAWFYSFQTGAWFSLP